MSHTVAAARPGGLRRVRACLPAAILALFPAAASAQSSLTVGVGQTVHQSTNATFQPLVMDGGELRIADASTGRALAINVTDAVLARGYINHWYAQHPGTTLTLFGTTSVPGAPACTAPCFPADGMTLRASPFDTVGLMVVNKGQIVQSGTGELTLISTVRIVQEKPATGPVPSFFIDNDRGIKGGGSFENKAGALIAKRAGNGTSDFAVFLSQQGGVVDVGSGTLRLSGGGDHSASTFLSNFAGGTRFAGAHVIRGGALSQTGNFLVESGATVTVQSGPGFPGSFWDMNNGRVEVAGTVVLEGGGLYNNGVLLTTVSGAINGRAGAQLVNTGSFSGNVLPGTDGSGFMSRIDVTNSGQFNVAVGQNVSVRNFYNVAGRLQVDGTLDNYDGRLQLLGGELWGSGMVNGDGITVGGGPGVAVFNPGSSPGTMVINGTFELLAGGVLNLEVEKVAGVLAYDKLVVSGPVLLDGRVNLHVGAGVTEADVAGLRFFACDFEGCTVDVIYGTGFDYAFPDRPGSMLTLDSTGFEITHLAPVPEPSVYALLLAGLGLVGFAARRARRLPLV